MFTPRARYRFYGSPEVYLGAARHALGPALGEQEDLRGPLERQIAGLVGVDHGICVPQARFGLYLAFARLLTPERPEVVMSPYTIHDVVNMVLCAGGRPVFADIEAATCNIDPARVEALIGERTGAVMVTHLHGLACDVERIAAVCDARGVPLVEDAAQAFGARVAGRMIGGFGKVGVFSFGRAKNINAFYGGMVVTSDGALAGGIRAELAGLPEEDGKKLAKRIVHCAIGDLMTIPPVFSPMTFRLFRFGAVHRVKAVNKIVQTEDDPQRKSAVPEPYRRRMTALQARLVSQQLPALDDHTARRLAIARVYHEGLADLPGIQLPPWRDDGSHIYLQYPVQLDDRWDYVRFMMTHGRDVAIQHMNSAAELAAFKDLARDCPVARETAERVVLLPTYPGYGVDEARANVEVTRAYLAGRASGDRPAGDAAGVTVVDGALDWRDVERLAAMHLEALPGSLVSLLGERYARTFYRFIAGSPDELVLLERGGDGRELSGACIVSLAPRTLARRLLWRTPAALFLPLAIGRLPRGALRAGLRGSARDTSPAPDAPEILLIYTSPGARGKGLGARLLERCEAILLARGEGRLLVKTRDEPTNAAVRFYQRCGFQRRGSLSKYGKQLLLFEKAL